MAFPTIVFPLTPALATLYSGFYWVSGATLSIPVHPDHYTPIWEDLGETGFIDGARQTLVKVASQRYGFELACPDGSPEFYAILDALRSNALGTGLSYAGIPITDQGTPRTVRIMELAQDGGLIDGYSQGFKLRCMELAPRRVI